MFSLAIVCSMLIVTPTSGRQFEDVVYVSESRVSLDVSDATLQVALNELFAAVHKVCRYDLDVVPIVKSVHRTADLRGVSMNDALSYLLKPHTRVRPTLSLRKEGEVYIFGQPTVSFDLANASAVQAITTLLSESGCDYCIDAALLPKRKATVSVTRAPLFQAFNKLMKQISPALPYELVFSHGCYLVRPVAEDNSDWKYHNVAAWFWGLRLESAIAAVCECLHKSSVVEVDGPVGGLANAQEQSIDAAGLLFELMRDNPSRFRISGSGEVITFTPAPAKAVY